MRILFVAAELSPIVKVGGLGDVIRSLPKALIELGHDVRIMLPRYGGADLSSYKLQEIIKQFKLHNKSVDDFFKVYEIDLNNSGPVYLVENEKYFGENEIYGSRELERFLIFCKAAVELLPVLEWQPEIVHCHDWHTALLTLWLKKFRLPYSSVFTIHNLAYQGVFDENFLMKYGLYEDWDRKIGNGAKLPLNFLCQGIINADLITTVSKNYAKEILTPEYGNGLESFLKYRIDSLVGILNGIDYDDYNPETDKYLISRYNMENIRKRIDNKLALQRHFGFEESSEIPLIGFVQRLDKQKGLDILLDAVDVMLNNVGIQLVILGSGEREYQDRLVKLMRNHTGHMGVFIGFDDSLSHLIYGGSDMYLMPSYFEPCGLGQLIAMRYGSVPIVRHTGGLVDTVAPLNEDLSAGNGFVFTEYSSEALVSVLTKAVEAYKSRKKEWMKLIKRIMNLDYSWNKSVREYEEVYKTAVKK